MQSYRPDWVQCPSCRTVYAPTLIGRYGCPRCGDAHWYPAAIPDAPRPPAQASVTPG